MNYVPKDLPKNSHVSFRWLNKVLVVRTTMMERIYENNKIRWNLFVPSRLIFLKLILRKTCLCFQVWEMFLILIFESHK